MLDRAPDENRSAGDAAAAGPSARGRAVWGASRVTLWFFAFVILAAAVCFGVKIHEFLADLLDEGGIGFAGSHLLNYMLVALGFFLLLVFAFLSGHFGDVEEVKFEMLEREVARDAVAFK